ncbi:SRPBCC family protein [Leucobacter japonicus]|uniref:SRPBCC family protein n=1 Tax=Leucobacter japonicus TaxID=1461259 RepID=UPI0006A7D7AC|nr:SRPBCC family protein [Leucobacter japonicus]
MSEDSRIVTAERVVSADAAALFELIADPSRQPEWDGNDNLSEAADGQRVHGIGDVFVMHNTGGHVRANHVVEFIEGRLIAWKPSPVGEAQPGHLWRWELEPVGDGMTLVRHTYDWSGLTDESRFERARSFTADALRASVDRLAELAETIVHD